MQVTFLSWPGIVRRDLTVLTRVSQKSDAMIGTSLAHAQANAGRRTLQRSPSDLREDLRQGVTDN